MKFRFSDGFSEFWKLRLRFESSDCLKTRCEVQVQSFRWNSDFQMDFQNSENDADVVAVQSHEIVVVDASKFLSRPRPLK